MKVYYYYIKMLKGDSAQIELGYKKTTKFMLIYFILFYSTGLLDSIISVSFKLQFYPGVAVTYKEIILSLASVLICTTFLLLMKKCNSSNVPLRVIMCVMVTLICYPYVLESNLSYSPIDKAVIS